MLHRIAGGVTAGSANRLLSLGYAGLAVALVGIVVWRLDLLPQMAATHLMTMGAMGSKILAFATRATMIRPLSGGLQPYHRQWLAMGLVMASAWVRLWAEFATGPEVWVTASGLIWCAGWAAFLSVHLPGLRRPAPFPVLSGLCGH